jgi:hypothetical protein
MLELSVDIYDSAEKLVDMTVDNFNVN